MRKSSKLFRTFLTAVVLILTGAALDAAAATFTVLNTNDSGPGSLRQAVLDANAAAGDDVIAFDASFNGPRTITLASLITITGNGGLTINGTGANLLTISGNNAVRVFELSGLNAPSIGAIVFNNLTIADGTSTPSGAGKGGGIGINNGVGTVTAVTFTANNLIFRNNRGGVNPGGAIGCTKGVVNVNNSIFTGGSANGGSAIDTGGGETCSINVSNSSFYENSLTGGDYVVNSGSGSGGGVGTLAISGSAFYNNGRNTGGSTIVVTGGRVTITNTTIANNRGVSAALLIGMNNNTAVNTLTNVTIAGNYSASSNNPGGFDQTVAANIVNVSNSIIANNFNPAGASDLEVGSNNTFTSQGYNLLENIGTSVIGGNTTGNLIGVDPWLAPLRDNGGATRTLALRPGSPAIDTGNPTTFPASDQRGIARPQDGDGNGTLRSDIGAFEKRLIDIVPTDKADFDGDGKTDLSIFRPAPGEWWYNKSTNGGNLAAQFGTSSDKLVPGDYTGDGKSDFAFFRPSTGQWFVLRSENFSFFAFPFGISTDTPVPADYDGDGKTDAAVFRASDLTWYISRSSGGTDIIGFGSAGDLPVAADYDGDGKADIAIYRPNAAGGSQWWVRRSSDASVFALIFGTPTDKTVQGDYTGDGKADIAFWRPSTGGWFVLRSEDFSFYSFPFGANGDTPVPGDYDGDGRNDAAVFRPSSSTWFAQRATGGTLIQQFGIAGDIPLPSAYVR